MTSSFDLLIIGGGINGTAIARDAAGRGLSVVLCERDDLASHTSSASTKLIHGGLRYLEYFEFGLVRKALQEREVLLRSAPHVIWPLRFILPYDKGLRPAWLLRLGLFIYDHLGGRKILPATTTVNLQSGPFKGQLRSRLTKGFEYSDCWVEDARLVTLNAVDAHERGARIRTQTTVKTIKAMHDGYEAEVYENEKSSTIHAKAVVNAAGPWVEDILQKMKPGKSTAELRLVKGSHIVTKKLFDGDHCYIFQNSDDRIIFAIPYESDYTLIGTTDNPYEPSDRVVEISEEEKIYLCESASEYFRKPVTPLEIVWTYSGVRPLFDDKNSDASAVTRDYVLKIDEFSENAPFLSIYGGKITTSRKLAEHVLEKLSSYLKTKSEPWTRDAILPGGDIKDADFDEFYEGLKIKYSAIDFTILKHLGRAYGTRAEKLLENCCGNLGQRFGPVLTEAEANYLVEYEWAKAADDVLWRRTKSGLHMTPSEQFDFKKWFEKTHRPNSPTTLDEI
ncbi:glycerol-3-phosphate dehydrogenase [Litorimonas cladophorae]|uniref:Glycerol-3-phosphate dehydrogenase n=1 Tax=Litorimonas cladophorae TaxID=1220491 RepID=A0A918KNT3_9PROT|nr:glycerol-3-phosphate dehydrogenase [Litorimonas cladophorae]GGX70835.1 glycerol-3-phosphate dehydrogenase [Litorimonas cladophorae]